MLFTHELEYSMNIENELSEAREQCQTQWGIEVLKY